MKLLVKMVEKVLVALTLAQPVVVVGYVKLE